RRAEMRIGRLRIHLAGRLGDRAATGGVALDGPAVRGASVPALDEERVGPVPVLREDLERRMTDVRGFAVRRPGDGVASRLPGGPQLAVDHECVLRLTPGGAEVAVDTS